MPALSFWDGTAWVQVGGVADGVHAVGPVAPPSPQLGTVWLDTSAPAQATPLVYGPNGEIMLHASGQGSVGRITRLAGPQEDVHLRAGDAVGSFAFVESASNVFLVSNAYWDGANWQRFDTAAPSCAFVAIGSGIRFNTAAAGANPITWTTTDVPAASLPALPFLLDPPRCRLYCTASPSIAHQTPTPVAMTTAIQNAGGAGGTAMWNSGVNPSRLTAPVAGMYEFGGTLLYSLVAGGGFRAAYLRINGATLVASAYAPPSATNYSHANVTMQTGMVAGDYIELCAYHDQGGPMNLQALGYEMNFWGRYVSPL